jgi:hypothetical protein
VGLVIWEVVLVGSAEGGSRSVTEELGCLRRTS